MDWVTLFAAHQPWNPAEVYCEPRSELSRIRLNSDAGSQYTSTRYTDTLALEGLQPSIGSVGDAYDNAAAETVMGLFKNEAVAKDSPFRSGALKTETEVMEIVLEWVH